MVLATVENFAMRYGPLRQIWLCAMGHWDESGYTQLATEADSVLWVTARNKAVQ
jgi:hypothetical protein